MLKVNGKGEYSIKGEPGSLHIEGEDREASIQPTPTGDLIVRLSDRVIRAEILSAEGKNLQVKIAHQKYDLVISDELDLLINRMGLKRKAGAQADNLKAPMPGLILEIRVEKGQKIKKGDILIILEAMKMENVIKAGHDGEVREILVEEKQSVEKNQTLMRF